MTENIQPIKTEEDFAYPPNLRISMHFLTGHWLVSATDIRALAVVESA